MVKDTQNQNRQRASVSSRQVSSSRGTANTPLEKDASIIKPPKIPVNSAQMLNILSAKKELSYNKTGTSTTDAEIPPKKKLSGIKQREEFLKISSKKGGQSGKRMPRGVETILKQFKLTLDNAEALEAVAQSQEKSTALYLNELLSESDAIKHYLNQRDKDGAPAPSREK